MDKTMCEAPTFNKGVDASASCSSSQQTKIPASWPLISQVEKKSRSDIVEVALARLSQGDLSYLK
jgi:hypothetical protein